MSPETIEEAIAELCFLDSVPGAAGHIPESIFFDFTKLEGFRGFPAGAQRTIAESLLNIAAAEDWPGQLSEDYEYIKALERTPPPRHFIIVLYAKRTRPVIFFGKSPDIAESLKIRFPKYSGSLIPKYEYKADAGKRESEKRKIWPRKERAEALFYSLFRGFIIDCKEEYSRFSAGETIKDKEPDVFQKINYRCAFIPINCAEDWGAPYTVAAAAGIRGTEGANNLKKLYNRINTIFKDADRERFKLTRAINQAKEEAKKNTAQRQKIEQYRKNAAHYEKMKKIAGDNELTAEFIAKGRREAILKERRAFLNTYYSREFWAPEDEREAKEYFSSHYPRPNFYQKGDDIECDIFGIEYSEPEQGGIKLRAGIFSEFIREAREHPEKPLKDIMNFPKSWYESLSGVEYSPLWQNARPKIRIPPKPEPPEALRERPTPYARGAEYVLVSPPPWFVLSDK